MCVGADSPSSKSAMAAKVARREGPTCVHRGAFTRSRQPVESLPRRCPRRRSCYQPPPPRQPGCQRHFELPFNGSTRSFTHFGARIGPSVVLAPLLRDLRHGFSHANKTGPLLPHAPGPSPSPLRLPGRGARHNNLRESPCEPPAPRTMLFHAGLERFGVANVWRARVRGC